MEMVDEGGVLNGENLGRLINDSHGLQLILGLRIYEEEFILQGTYEVLR